FGDPRAEVYGLARIGLTSEGASGLALLFAGAASVAVRAEGGAPSDGGLRPTARLQRAVGGWEGVRAAGVTTRVVEPLTRWKVGFDGGEGGGFALDVRAVGAPAVLD